MTLVTLSDLPMFIIDVTRASAKKLTWKNSLSSTGEVVRSLRFEVTRPEDAATTRHIVGSVAPSSSHGSAGAAPATEMLDIIRTTHTDDLKDVFRAWRMRLH